MTYHFPTITTLCYILNGNNEVLLSMKKRGVGVGRWNGQGGKVKEGESLEGSVIREVEEETGLKVANLINRGVLEFVAPEKPEIQSRCHIYVTRDFEVNLIVSTSRCARLKRCQGGRLPSTKENHESG